MNAHTAVPFVDTNIIPDRNAGIGSLLWDLQNPLDPDRDGPPLLRREFAFIDVGASRARVATTLRTLLARDLGMDVDYVATERPEVVPYAHVTPLGDRAEKIRGCLSAMVSSKRTTLEVRDWHCVLDCQGKVSSIAYSYNLHGNEVWESYFMGRPFMYSGQRVEFSDPALDEVLAPEVSVIEARSDLDLKRDGASRPRPSWDGYRIEGHPLETGLARFGISLQQTDVPRRIEGRQNVLFLGNVLNHHPRDEQARELDRIAAGMEAGDLVIVQMDDTEMPSIEVLHVEGHGAHKTRERVRWINTRKLEIQTPVRGAGTWRQIQMEQGVERMAGRLTDCLEMRLSSPKWGPGDHKALGRQSIRQVLRTYLRALPVEETLRVAIREAVRRWPPDGGPKGIPVFKDDARDAHGGALGPDPRPIVSEAEFTQLGLTNPGSPRSLGSGHRGESDHPGSPRGSLRSVGARSLVRSGRSRKDIMAGVDNGWMRTRWARTTRVLTVMSLPLLLPLSVAAQGAASQAPAGAPSASELAKQTQNPIASLISVPLEGNWDMGVGDREATGTLLNVQPVIPFSISKGTNVVLRVITPLLSQPSSAEDGNRVNGVGDIVLSAFFSPAKSGRVIWGVGPVLLLPTATTGTLGSEKFGLGPTAVVLTQPGNWTFGMLANQIWSTSGAYDREDVNKTYLQPFMDYNLGSGLSVGVSAEATGNWEADDEKWSAPLLFRVGKVTMLGKRPVKLQVGVGPTFGPAAGPDWRFRFAATFLFPR